MVTVVPLSATGPVTRWTQNVSPLVPRNCETSVWFGPSVRARAPSQSLPTPNTSELLRVVTRDAAGASAGELLPPVAPMAPEPLVPDVSTPLKLTTVMAAATFCDNAAVTDTLVNT